MLSQSKKWESGQLDARYLKSRIRDVPDFPRKGIVFKDITTLLKDPVALNVAIREMKSRCLGKKIDLIVGIESRGFILGGILANDLGVGFVPVRKKGKLPAQVVSAEYELEYGTDNIEMHEDGIVKNQNVVIIDDLLATGGTAKAATQLVERLGGHVTGLGFLIELNFLQGRKKLADYDVFSLIQYDAE